MKRFLIALSLVVLAGAGCAKHVTAPDLTAYENAPYGFAFDYPKNMEIHVPTEATRKVPYLGIAGEYFIALRDTVAEEKPLNIASFFAAGLTVDDFVKKLEASGTGIVVKSKEPVEKNGLKMTKVTSTTESGEEKIHYLFDHAGTTVIVEEFLYQHDAFAPILDSFRPL